MHLPPFARGIDAGAETIMVNSGAVNGVPVHASHELLTGLLRDELGFEGVVGSDWEDILKLQTVHGVAATYEDAIVMAINAGIDMSMVPIDATGFTTRLIALVEAGRISQARIDEAVRRILVLKFRLGLFEHPYADVDAAEDIEGDAVELARQAAADTMTLLENDGVLPLRRKRADILVTGPSADSMVNQLGGWSIGWQGATVPGEVPEGVTVREGIEDAVGAGSRVRYAADRAAAAVPPRREGGRRGGRRGRRAALRRGRRGHRHRRAPAGAGGAARRAGGHREARGGRGDGGPPADHERAARGAAAALMAYLPGTQGGRAVADALFGKVNPSGRLSVTWPKSVDQAPLTHDRASRTTRGTRSATA